MRSNQWINLSSGHKFRQREKYVIPSPCPLPALRPPVGVLGEGRVRVSLGMSETCLKYQVPTGIGGRFMLHFL